MLLKLHRLRRRKYTHHAWKQQSSPCGPFAHPNYVYRVIVRHLFNQDIDLFCKGTGKMLPVILEGYSPLYKHNVFCSTKYLWLNVLLFNFHLHIRLPNINFYSSSSKPPIVNTFRLWTHTEELHCRSIILLCPLLGPAMIAGLWGNVNNVISPGKRNLIDQCDNQVMQQRLVSESQTELWTRWA